MSSLKQQQRLLKEVIDSRRPAIESIPAVMGDGLGGLIIPGRPNYVYVTINDKVYEAFSGSVVPDYGKHIWVGLVDTANPSSRLYQVLSVRTLLGTDESTQLGYAPAKRYEWLADGGGQDPVYIHMRAFTPMRIGMSASGGLNVELQRGFVFNGTERFAIATQDLDLSSYVPVTAGKALFVLITIDATGTLIYTVGSEVDIDALTLADIPLPPTDSIFECGAVRLYEGQALIQEARTNTDFVDLRFTGVGPPGGITIGQPYRVLFTNVAGIVSQELAFRYFDNSDGSLSQLHLGPTNPYAGDYVFAQANNGASATHVFATYSDGNHASLVEFIRGGGNDTAVTKVLNNMRIGAIAARPFYEDALLGTSTARITFVSDEDMSVTNRGTRIEFSTTALASATRVTRLTLEAGGELGWLELSGTPSTPETNEWKLYFKAGGLYTLDDAGTETLLSTGGGSPVDGSGITGQIAQWADSNTLTSANLIGPAANILTLEALGAYTVTFPATLTVAGLAIANVFTAVQTITPAIGNALVLNGDVLSDRYLAQNTNTFFGIGNAGVTLAHTTGLEGYQNTLIGNANAPAITKGYQNVSIGYGNLTLLNTGVANVAIGVAVMTAATSASTNFAMGAFALRYVQTGTDNVAIGVESGSSAVASAKTGVMGNVFIGYRSGLSLITNTSYNVFIGDTAGYSNSGSFNVGIGRRAGYLNNGASNVFLGAYSGRRQTAASNTLFINNQEWASAAEELTNSIVYGTFGATPLASTLRLNAVSTIAVNTTTTNAPLVLFDLNAYVSTAATGFANGGGVAFTMTGETATDGTSQLMAQIASTWVDATNATRKAKLSLSAYDTAVRLGMEIEASGTEPIVNVFGSVNFTRTATSTGTVGLDRHVEITHTITSDGAVARFPQALFADLVTAGAVAFASSSVLTGLQGRVLANAAITVNQANGLTGSIISNNASSVITTGNGLVGQITAETAGTITTATALQGRLVRNGGDITITDLRLISGGVLFSNGVMTIANMYGLYLENISLGATLNYSIYTNAGNVMFNGGGDANTDFTIQSDTEANMFFLDASANTLQLGGTATSLEVVKGGDTFWIGAGSGLPFGSCWGNEIAWAQAAAVQNTWYEISDADMTDGQLNLVTHDGSGKLTVSLAGKYLIAYSISAECNTNAKHVQSGISVSGTEQNDGIAHHETHGANEQFLLANTAILSLAANDTIEISIRTTDAGAPDFAVDHLNITLAQVGG